jgi:hypothetical protein
VVTITTLYAEGKTFAAVERISEPRTLQHYGKFSNSWGRFFTFFPQKLPALKAAKEELKKATP